MSIKISELPQATSVGSSDIVPIVQGGTTKQATAGMMNLDAYSTTEQKIGTWIDGKPLYRKIITGTTTAGTNFDISKNSISANIDKFVYFGGVTIQPGNNISPIPYFSSETDRTAIYYANSINAIRIRPGSEYGYGNITVIVEYTKTTDSATRSLNLTRTTNTGSLVGLGDKAEVTDETLEKVKLDEVTEVEENNESGDLK